jgi:hypothetical protein
VLIIRLRQNTPELAAGMNGEVNRAVAHRAKAGRNGEVNRAVAHRAKAGRLRRNFAIPRCLQRGASFLFGQVVQGPQKVGTWHILRNISILDKVWAQVVLKVGTGPFYIHLS